MNVSCYGQSSAANKSWFFILVFFSILFINSCFKISPEELGLILYSINYNRHGMKSGKTTWCNSLYDLQCVCGGTTEAVSLKGQTHSNSWVIKELLRWKWDIIPSWSPFIHMLMICMSFIFRHTGTHLRKSAPMWKMYYNIFFSDEQLINVWANVSAIRTIPSILISCLTSFLRFSVQSCNYCLCIFRRTSLIFWPCIGFSSTGIHLSVLQHLQIWLR